MCISFLLLQSLFKSTLAKVTVYTLETYNINTVQKIEENSLNGSLSCEYVVEYGVDWLAVA